MHLIAFRIFNFDLNKINGMEQSLEKNKENEKVKYGKTYGIYTILFCVLSLLVFAIFVINHKSFIWQEDGIKQHYVFLYDFHQIMSNFLKNDIPMLSWNMGLGLDVIGQYSYYTIGDPFAYLSLLFPLKYLETTYNILVILRIYCIGLSFIAYCQYHKKERLNTILGALIYTFCGFTLYAGVRHPYFMNATILLPLNLIGVDKLLKDNKKIYFIFIIFVSIINNYYFFYMIAIVSAIYGIIKYVIEYNKGIKHFFRKLGNATICYVIGILMASVILLPTIYTFLESARTEGEKVLSYISGFYKFFFMGIISIRFKNWTVICVSSLALLMIATLITRLKEKEVMSYLLLFLITTVMLLIPQVASAMNGFSFPSNRWVFAYSFILAYIVTIGFKKNINYSKKQKILMYITLILYTLFGVWITKFKINKYPDYYEILILTFFMLALLSYPYRKEKSKKIACVFLFVFVITGIFINSVTLYSTNGNGYVEEFVESGKAEEICASAKGKVENYKEAIAYIKENDKEFYRIAKKDTSYQNLSLLYQYHPIQLFLSLGNKNVYGLSNSLEDNNYSSTQCVNGADRRTKLTTLLSNKYYICDKKDKKYLPYCYKLYYEIGNTQIYINQNYLPIGLLYDRYITKEEYETMSPLQKEDSLLTTAMLDKMPTHVQKEENILERITAITKLKYTVKDNKIKNNTITISKEKENVELNIMDIPDDVEVYLNIKNIQYKSQTKKTDFKIVASLNGISNSEKVLDITSSAYYIKNSDFLMNLGVSSQNRDNKLKIIFNNKGIYNFDSLEVLAVPMYQYEEKVSKLKKNSMKNIQYGNNYLKGIVEANQNGILQITTSYSNGWKAYIDGKEVDVLKVNEAFIGIEIEEGKHQVEFRYTTPYIKLGIFFSITGMIGYLIVIVIDREKNSIR